jgi:uncharacterized protein (DUF1697 family)
MRTDGTTSYVALLRAVNLGPHNQVPKDALRQIGEELGFLRSRTYIASGNLLFDTAEDERAVKAALVARLTAYAGKPIQVIVRTGSEMRAIRDANPFADAPGNRVLVSLLDEPPPTDALAHARHVQGEQMALGIREIYVRYTDDGMGTSKLAIPAARSGTSRNMNTVIKLTDMLND